jgi:hypothetical protein
MVISLTFFQGLVLSARPQSTGSESCCLRVAVDEVKRLNAHEVEFRVTLANETDHEVFLPGYRTAEGFQLRTLSIYQHGADGGWRRLGSGSELPLGAVLPLKPGQEYSLITRLPDPVLTPRPGEGIPTFKGEMVPLVGKHKVVLRYFASQEDWLSYQKRALTPQRGHPPKLKRAESSEYEVPPQSP